MSGWRQGRTASRYPPGCHFVAGYLPEGHPLLLPGQPRKEGSLGAMGEPEGKIPGCAGRRELAHTDVMEGRWLFQGPG